MTGLAGTDVAGLCVKSVAGFCVHRAIGDGAGFSVGDGDSVNTGVTFLSWGTTCGTNVACSTNGKAVGENNTNAVGAIVGVFLAGCVACVVAFVIGSIVEIGFGVAEAGRWAVGSDGTTSNASLVLHMLSSMNTTAITPSAVVIDHPAIFFMLRLPAHRS